MFANHNLCQSSISQQVCSLVVDQKWRNENQICAVSLCTNHCYNDFLETFLILCRITDIKTVYKTTDFTCIVLWQWGQEDVKMCKEHQSCHKHFFVLAMFWCHVYQSANICAVMWDLFVNYLVSCVFTSYNHCLDVEFIRWSFIDKFFCFFMCFFFIKL